jgi:hypothetical protein
MKVYRLRVFTDCGPRGFDTMTTVNELYGSVDKAKARAEVLAGHRLTWKEELHCEFARMTEKDLANIDEQEVFE